MQLRAEASQALLIKFVASSWLTPMSRVRTENTTRLNSVDSDTVN